MKKIKIGFFKDDRISHRLSTAEYLQKLSTVIQGFSSEVEIFEIENNQEKILYYLSGTTRTESHEVVFLTPQKSDVLMSRYPKIPAEVIESGYADILVCQESRFWPRNLLATVMKEMIIETKPDLNTHSIAYVTGSDALCQMCVATAVSMGFQRIIFVSEDLNKVQHRIENLQKKFFGIHFQVIKDTELTLQPNNGSLLLNTISEEINPILFEDLTYLNYVSKAGLVIHLPLSFAGNSLLQEAQHVGVQTLSGEKIYARRDFSFLKYYQIVSGEFDEFFEHWNRSFGFTNQD